MLTPQANEVAQQARMLTILALYHSYSGDDALLLKHFAKAKALADWCVVLQIDACSRRLICQTSRQTTFLYNDADVWCTVRTAYSTAQ